MSLRCGCEAEGDEIVFGPIHQCSPEGMATIAWRDEQERLGHEARYMETLDEAERRGD
jgi:hypothetical protein